MFFVPAVVWEIEYLGFFKKLEEESEIEYFFFFVFFVFLLFFFFFRFSKRCQEITSLSLGIKATNYSNKDALSLRKKLLMDSSLRSKIINQLYY